jgi:hypothetical protein
VTILRTRRSSPVSSPKRRAGKSDDPRETGES